MCYIVLWCIAVRCSVLQCDVNMLVLQYGVVACAVCCSVLQCVAMCCIVLQCIVSTPVLHYGVAAVAAFLYCSRHAVEL